MYDVCAYSVMYDVCAYSVMYDVCAYSVQGFIQDFPFGGGGKSRGGVDKHL